MTSILLLGATGLLGSTLASSLKSYNHKVICQSRTFGSDVNFDLLNDTSWHDCLVALKPDVIIISQLQLMSINVKRIHNGRLTPMSHQFLLLKKPHLQQE